MAHMLISNTFIHLLILLLLQSSNASTHIPKTFQSPFNDINHLLKSRHLLQICSATASLPEHTHETVGNYGYYFQAPTNFAITSISVPTDASSDRPTAAIIRFTNGPPVNWWDSTNDFTQLLYWSLYSKSTIPTNCICVESGQYIGILGYRGTSNWNSVGDAPYNSTINGYSVTFRTLEMDRTYSLVSNPPHGHDVYSHSGSLGRVHFTYTVCGDSCSCFGRLTPQPTQLTQAPTTPTLLPSVSPTQPSVSPTQRSISPTLLPSTHTPSISPIQPLISPSIDKSNVTETKGSNITVIAIIMVM
eukprot:263942_1